MTLDFQDAVLLILWVAIGTLMLSLVAAISLNKTLKAKVGCTLVVILAFVLIVAWVDRKFFKQPWYTERPLAQADGGVPMPGAQPHRAHDAGGAHA